jgi:hypothetical protein
MKVRVIKKERSKARYRSDEGTQIKNRHVPDRDFEKTEGSEKKGTS